MDWIEPTAAVFGLLAVWLNVRRHIACWPTGLVQVSLYLWVFYQAKLNTTSLLAPPYGGTIEKLLKLLLR